MRKQKKLIMALVLLLAVGFAAVTTTLLINGNALIGTTEFDVYFSSASIDGVENNTIISQDGKSITYETVNLQVAGDTSELDYTITNNSSQYDAEVSIECDFSENDYVRLENSLQNEVIEAKSEKEGTLTATLIKTSTEERSQGFTCTIVANAKERDTAGEDTIVDGEINTYSLYGTLTDEEGNPLPNTTVVAYSNPVYTVTDENGYFYMEGIEKGSHTLYVMGSKSIEEVKELDEEEVAAQAVTKASYTTSSVNIVFENDYKIKNKKLHKTKKFNVTFNPNGGNVDVLNKEYTMGKDLTYGSLPVPTKDNAEFVEWTQSSISPVTSETKYTKEENHILTAVWKVCDTGNFNLCWVDRDVEETKSVGDIITIGTENFHIVSYENNNVNLLTMYNLYVGGDYDSSTKVYTPYDNPTGIQDSTMLGDTYGTLDRGVTAFSTSEQKGDSYNDYEGSLAKTYVDNYVNYMNSTYNLNATGRLLEKGEYNGLGSSTTSYWTQTKAEKIRTCRSGSCTVGTKTVTATSDYIVTVDAPNDLLFYVVPGMECTGGSGIAESCYDITYTGDAYSKSNIFGVRPVITISADLIK